MIDVAVVTHTRDLTSPLLARATESVRVALRPGMRHLVLDGSRAYVDFRFEALREADYLAFVDADDEVLPHALEDCANALIDTGVGLAFTREVCVSAVTGLDVSASMMAPDASYASIAMSPRAAHHLVMMRTSCVDRYAYMASVKCGGSFIDWLMVASVALTSGAVYLPEPGYRWTVDQPTSDSVMNVSAAQRYKEDVKRIIQRRWGVPRTAIPRWTRK